MRYSTNKDLNDLARLAVTDGWSIEFTGGGHLRWVTPCGRRTFFSSQSPSCAFAVRKVEADMRRTLKAAASLNPVPVTQTTEKEKPMQQPLTHKMTLPKPRETPLDARYPAPHPHGIKPTLTFATAKQRVLSLVAEGKAPHDAVTVILAAYRVIAPIFPDKEWDHAKLLAYSLKPYSKKKRQAAIEQEEEQEQVTPAPSASSSSKPKPITQPKEKANRKVVGEEVIEQALKHVRATLDMPFSKEKKQEIILDLLDELL